MRKMTLLEMVQNILSSMSSDEVNSIGDTVESLQVAEEVRNAFYDLYTNRDIPEFEGLINLQAVNNVLTPNRLVLPDNVLHIKWLKYKNFRHTGANHFHDIDYLAPEDFIRRIVEMDMGASTPYVEVPLLSTSPITYAIKANKHPHFYTVLDQDKTLLFDSFDRDSESFLTGSNALAWGLQAQSFTMEDSFIPPIDANLFPQLLSEAKSASFINIKEVSNAKEEQRARRHLVRSQTRMAKTKDQREGVFQNHDYARHRGGYRTYRRNHYGRP